MTEWSRKRRVIRHYDRIASIYDRQYGEEQEAKINAILPHICLNEQSLTLDVGCGTGILFPMIASKVLSAIGVDSSKKLLQKAKQYTRRNLNTHIICADSDYLPFQNNVFNLVFAITLLQNTPNPLKTLEEMKRTSRNQATFVVTALKKEFSEGDLRQLLKKAQLKILTMKTDEKLKDCVAICQTQHNQ